VSAGAALSSDDLLKFDSTWLKQNGGGKEGGDLYVATGYLSVGKVSAAWGTDEHMRACTSSRTSTLACTTAAMRSPCARSTACSRTSARAITQTCWRTNWSAIQPGGASRARRLARPLELLTRGQRPAIGRPLFASSVLASAVRSLNRP
jgi:hypothetical protein